MINYPMNYAPVSEEEMTYLEGGISLSEIGTKIGTGINSFINKVYTLDQNLNKVKVKRIYDGLFGNYMYTDIFIPNLQADLWASMQAGNLDAFETRRDTVEDYSVIGQIAYIYNVFRMAEWVLYVLVS